MHLYTLVASGLIVMFYLYYYNKFKYVVDYLNNFNSCRNDNVIKYR